MSYWIPTADTYPHWGLWHVIGAEFFPQPIQIAFFTFALFTKQVQRLTISPHSCLFTLWPHTEEPLLLQGHLTKNAPLTAQVLCYRLSSSTYFQGTLGSRCLLYVEGRSPASPRPSRGQNQKAKRLWGRAFRNYVPQPWNRLLHF